LAVATAALMLFCMFKLSLIQSYATAAATWSIRLQVSTLHIRLQINTSGMADIAGAVSGPGSHLKGVF